MATRVVLLVTVILFCSCSWFGSRPHPPVPAEQQATLVLLPARLDAAIDKASQVETLPDDLSPDEDLRRAAEAARAVRSEARRIFLEKIEAGKQFKLVPLDEVDAVVEEIGLASDKELTREHLTVIRERLKADLIVQPAVLDYGKVRWYWLAGGMLADMTWESVALGPRDQLASGGDFREYRLRTVDQHPGVVRRRLSVWGGVQAGTGGGKRLGPDQRRVGVGKPRIFGLYLEALESNSGSGKRKRSST